MGTASSCTRWRTAGERAGPPKGTSPAHGARPLPPAGPGGAATPWYLTAEHGRGCRFQRLTGTDYSEAGVQLARDLLARLPATAPAGLRGAALLVDDVLASKVAGPFQLVTDKGTLDAVGLHPTQGAARRRRYRHALTHLVSPGGLLVSGPLRRRH